MPRSLRGPARRACAAGSHEPAGLRAPGRSGVSFRILAVLASSGACDIGARVEAKWRNTEQYSEATIVDYNAQTGTSDRGID